MQVGGAGLIPNRLRQLFAPHFFSYTGLVNLKVKSLSGKSLGESPQGSYYGFPDAILYTTFLHKA